MRSSELTRAISMSRRTLERHLKTLKEKNLVHFTGSPKTGGYYPVRGDSASKAPEA
jgi:DNA-binding HxlR family transcriptional regulator